MSRVEKVQEEKIEKPKKNEIQRLPK